MREHEKIATTTAALKTLQAAFNTMTAAFETMTVAFEMLSELMPDGEIVTETITEGDGAGKKIQHEDCAACLCNTCANIDKCCDAPAGQELIGVRPYPCDGCLDGMKYVDVDEQCVGYVTSNYSTRR
ncbi:MAG: hypothetical protein FWG63_02245 [Defluviitaleaceae bacterium]|nr:hypothetical protein [Defluviitaleaceae bacterium]